MTPVPSMQSLVQQYVDQRRRFGFALEIPAKQLMDFARFADEKQHRGPLSSRIILEWVQGRATRAARFTWARRLVVIRPFLKHLAGFIPGVEIPPAGIFGSAKRRLTPHIYTDQEITDLVTAAGQMQAGGTLRSAVYQTLFGLIAATGLRISEALNLRWGDINLTQGALTVRQTKFCKSRLLPLHPTVIAALAGYASLRQRRSPVSENAPFFISVRGSRLPKSTAHQAFQRLRKKLQWTARGGHAAPRIHDLRHTFICRRVMLWHKHGINIDHAMVVLSTYVGHAKVTDTYWYLTAVPELMAVAGNSFERFASELGEDAHE